jgi:hypothetical protein
VVAAWEVAAWTVAPKVVVAVVRRRGIPPQADAADPRAALDEPVKAMFRAADGNHDGIVTLAELEAVIAARREAIIRARFERIDADHDGRITMDEFMAWQKSLGSVAAGQDRALADHGPVPKPSALTWASRCRTACWLPSSSR